VKRLCFMNFSSGENKEYYLFLAGKYASPTFKDLKYCHQHLQPALGRKEVKSDSLQCARLQNI
jgi:hypothetical protein